MLLGGLLLCVLLGGLSFLIALQLCGVKGMGIATLKYVLAIISIEALTNIFMIVLCPSEFIVNSHIFKSMNMVIGFILFWVLIYEASWLLKHPKLSWIKNLNPFSK